MVTACGLLVWTFRCLGKNLTDTVVTRQEHTLVMQGPYRWVRHPFYDFAASRPRLRQSKRCPGVEPKSDWTRVMPPRNRAERVTRCRHGVPASMSV